MPRVLIHPATYDDVREAVERVFELLPLELRGKRVLLKPNVLRACRPEEGVTTHPALLRAVVEKVEESGPAELVVGDNPGMSNYGANEEAFRVSGLMEAAKGYYRNIGEDSRGVAFNPAFMDSASVSSAVLDADVIISLPKFKTHGLTVLSGAFKNSYGILPGGLKARLHRAAGNPERFHELVVEVFRLRVPDLFIMDAVVGMEGNGPVSTDLLDVGLVLASDNAVALDSVMAAMVGCDPGKLGFLRKAKELGLGDYDLRNIEIFGELKRLHGFKLPPLGGEANHDDQEVQGRLLQRTLLRPGVDPDLCTGCGTCVEKCPVSALSMEGGLPQLAADACITCFCCQELCPERAITLT